MKLVLVSVAAIALASSVGASAAPRYAVERTGTVSGWRINNAGKVVGLAADETGIGAASYFRGVTKFEVPVGPMFSEARGVNNNGEIVGQLGGSGFYSKSGSLVPLPFVALDVNDSGTVVGQNHIWSEGVDRIVTPQNWHTEFYSINNAGMIAGWSNFGSGTTQALIYDGTNFTNLGLLVNGGLYQSYAEGMSENGNVSVYGETSLGTSQAYLYRGGVLTLAEGMSHAHGVNDSGILVGIGDRGAAVWKDGRTSYLSELVDPALNLRFDWAVDINDAGQILAYGTGGTYILTPVPEPGSWALMICGFVLVGSATRRRARIAVSYS